MDYSIHSKVVDHSVQMQDGTIKPRTTGTPQGGVISPVLANLFLHYTFDSFMAKEYPKAWWARYADDGIVHCKTYDQAVYMRTILSERFKIMGLELNQEKTRIVYCKDADRMEDHVDISFDFLVTPFDPDWQRINMARFSLAFYPACLTRQSKELKKKLMHGSYNLKLTNTLTILPICLMPIFKDG